MDIFKKRGSIFFLLLLFLNLGATGTNRILEGQTAKPAFNHLGDLVYVYKNAEKKISLETLKPQTEEPSEKTVFLEESAFSPVIKRDRSGKLWIVWEEWEYNQSILLLGQLKEDVVISSRKITEEEGFNFSPDLSFDVNDNPWIVWINYKAAQYRIFVHEVISEKTWVMDTEIFSSACSPRVIVDLNNNVWIFWSGKGGGEEEIFCRAFDYFSWSPLYKINQSNKYPHVNPSVAVDQKGFIWLVWSGYDGQDYEIYFSYWNQEKWSEEIKITDNSQKNDVFPSVSVISNSIPIVSWAQSFGGQCHIKIKFLENNTWSKEIDVFPGEAHINFPIMIVEGEKIGIIWQSEYEVKSEVFYFNQLREKESFGFVTADTQIIINPDLDESRYIGYGDSITYGYINKNPTPEKGYVPRLKAILIKMFGEAEVVNEGNPGEITQGGLGRIESLIQNLNSRYLLLMEGTNDVFFMEISMDTAAFNLKEMVKKCMEFGVFPAISTIPPRPDWMWDREFYRYRIFYLNNKIQELAQDYLIPLVNMFDAFYFYPEDKGGWRSLFSDNVHPDEKGYQLMAEEWFDVIQNFPFPPTIFQVKRISNEILFYREVFNHITWQDNPKIQDKSTVYGYKIYRKKVSLENSQFELITTVYNDLSFFDKNIVPSEKYVYVISTLRKDNVEGPCSGERKDH
ncbi:MAG: GDSL-type esterase/lipase family protein [Candidatus Aminicenantaceae bacterium]